MTKLDLVLARLRKLSPERQEEIAKEIEFRLDHDGALESVFSDTEWAETEATMDESGDDVPHERVIAEMSVKYPFRNGRISAVRGGTATAS